MTDKPDKTLLALARRLEKLANAPADQRFIQLGTYSPDFTAAIAEARQDAVLQWVDTLMVAGPGGRRARVGPLGRTEAVRFVIERTKLARTTVFAALLAAERRYGRPRHAVGRPRRDGSRPDPSEIAA
jgi:hypothetical protein